MEIRSGARLPHYWGTRNPGTPYLTRFTWGARAGFPFQRRAVGKSRTATLWSLFGHHGIRTRKSGCSLAGCIGEGCRGESVLRARGLVNEHFLVTLCPPFPESGTLAKGPRRVWQRYNFDRTHQGKRFQGGPRWRPFWKGKSFIPTWKSINRCLFLCLAFDGRWGRYERLD